MSKTLTYKRWRGMLRRCYEPGHVSYPRYGAKGIKVCDSWRSFERFFHDMGECQPGMTLGRIDNGSDYSPTNCRWETVIEQANNKRNSRRITWGGKTQTIAQWERELGFNDSVIKNRINRYGWSVERAITTPSYGRSRKYCKYSRGIEAWRT